VQLAIEIDPAGAPLQTQIFEEIRNLIVSGRLLPGTCLPGSRSLSEQLDVSRNTIILAYEALISEGYLQSREGAGTFVSHAFPDAPISPDAGPARKLSALRPIEVFAPVAEGPKPSDLSHEMVWDFALERTDPATFPQSVWRRITNWRMRSQKFNLTYLGTPKGLRELRETLAGYLGATRGISCSPENILIVTGIQQALNVAAHLFVRAGTKVIMEAPGCSVTAMLFKAYGAKILPVPIDRNGLITKYLPQSQPCVAFATPARHYPMGYGLSAARRDELLFWSRQTGSYVVELDFDTEIRYEGPPPASLKSFDRDGQVIYIGSFAGSIGPGLRVGYIVLSPDLMDAAVQAVALFDHGFPCAGLPWLEQAVLNDFIESGGLDTHLRKLRRTYMARRDCLVASLQRQFGSVQIEAANCGTHLVWELPTDFPSAQEVQQRMLKNKVGVYTLHDQNVAGAEYLENCDRYLLFGFAAITETAIEEGISRLALELG
jgi:GntR family transcriptional regulator / MocR family aminotransferase